ncbi:hypothetical protein AURDEDRAFT_173511 [Auricularia subglabra TFB-10046 SS5]|nr:hypothetical protein AURDEDRAFT_173511 [Auricularia subglabra TFB-10046 SS5]
MGALSLLPFPAPPSARVSNGDHNTPSQLAPLDGIGTASTSRAGPLHLASLFKVPRAADVLESGFDFYNPRRFVALATTLDGLSIAPAAAQAGWGCLWVAHATIQLRTQSPTSTGPPSTPIGATSLARAGWGPRRRPGVPGTWRLHDPCRPSASSVALLCIPVQLPAPEDIPRAASEANQPARVNLPRVVHPASIDQVSCLLLPAASVSHTTRRIFLTAQRVWMVSRGGLLMTLEIRLAGTSTRIRVNPTQSQALSEPPCTDAGDACRTRCYSSNPRRWFDPQRCVAAPRRAARQAGILVALPVQWRLARSPSFEAGHTRRRVPKLR